MEENGVTSDKQLAFFLLSTHQYIYCLIYTIFLMYSSKGQGSHEICGNQPRMSGK